MKQFGVFVGLLLMGSALFGQIGVYDNDFKRPPSISLEHLDSVRVVRISEAWAGGMSRNPIKKPGYLDIVIELDREQRLISYDKYNDDASRVTDSYEFIYSGKDDFQIEQVYSATPKSHRWVFRDSLIQEVELLKGLKKKLKAHWIYTYRDDTLITSLVKYDKNGNAKYQCDYAYSEQNRLIRQTITERGKPTRWLEATYDDEGNLVGYRNDDERKSISGSQVAIVRDSSDQVTSVSYQSRGGTRDLWVYEYNEAEKPVKAILRNATGEEKQRIEYRHDTNGNEVRKTIIEKEKEKQRRDREYDERGNLIFVHYYRRFMGNLDLVYYYGFIYDKSDRLVRKDYWNKDYSQRKRWDYEYELF